MISQIDFAAPAAGFDQPIQMWLECHERVRRFSGLLRRLALQALANPDADAQACAHSIRRYFNEAAPRHHEDEEIDLFPCLSARAPVESRRLIAETIDRLETEHLDLARRWNRIDAALERVTRGQPAGLDPALADEFATLYQRHLACEEEIMLPGLGQFLSDDDRLSIGCAMAARRGVDWKPIPTRVS